ncbi:acetyl-CoA carboxylase biotin carboxyl carrier protein [Nonomuraea sp. NPDC050153]|uniref:acetyl-CoA carboxylase biotin carboxyl carrier protein n=1 Tax=Nonomuraea sp. NPDC050153 TaxID=3364359 RepID=UPI0037BADC8F
MTEHTDERHAALRLLREEAGNLVKTVPGPLASLSLRVGEWALDISWAHGTAPAGPLQAVTAAEEETEAADPGLHEVTAPLVGTFYVAPEPGAPPYIQVGEYVRAGQTVGLVEAMKLMNPVRSDLAGEVVEVVTADATPVEYGQALVRIRAEEP